MGSNVLELTLSIISVNVFVILFLWGYFHERKNKDDLFKENESNQ